MLPTNNWPVLHATETTLRSHSTYEQALRTVCHNLWKAPISLTKNKTITRNSETVYTSLNIQNHFFQLDMKIENKFTLSLMCLFLNCLGYARDIWSAATGEAEPHLSSWDSLDLKSQMQEEIFLVVFGSLSEAY